MAGTTSASVTKCKLHHYNKEDRRIYCDWKFPTGKNEKWYNKCAGYEVQWYYTTAGSSTDFKSTYETVSSKQSSVYSLPDEAITVYCKVKPISKQDKNKKNYFTGTWTKSNVYTPPVRSQSSNTYTPTPIVDGTTVTATVTVTAADNAKAIDFQLVDPSKILSTGGSSGLSITLPGGIVLDDSGLINASRINLVNNIATYTFNGISPYIKYRMRCRLVYNDNSLQSWDNVSWSDEFDASSILSLQVPTLSDLKENSDGTKSFNITGSVTQYCLSIMIEISKNGNPNLTERISNVPVGTGYTYSYTYTSAEYNTTYQARIIGITGNVNGLITYTNWSDWSSSIGPLDGTPSSPTNEIVCKLQGNSLNMSVSYTDIQKADVIIFEVWESYSKCIFTGNALINKDTFIANTSCTLSPGCSYNVRCRAYSNVTETTSSWSSWSGDIRTVPDVPDGFISISAVQRNEVELRWNSIPNVDFYAIQYTMDPKYFDSGSDKVSTISDIKHNVYYITLSDAGTYYFRLAAGNEAGYSGYSEYKSITIGLPPAAPTTWQSKSVASIGDELSLYWTHNTRDGSKLTKSLVTTTINNENPSTKEYSDLGGTTSDDSSTRTQVLRIDTSEFSDPTAFKWYVRTKGVLDEYSEASVERMIMLYAKPSLAVGYASEYTSYPINFEVQALPLSQKPIGFYISIVSDENYETLDNTYTEITVSKGQQIYYKYYDTSDNNLSISLTPGDMRLENGVKYKFTIVASMNSGLTAEFEGSFITAFSDAEFPIDVSMGYVSNTYSMMITPFSMDDNTNYLDGISFSVYRREYDGSFTEIAKDLKNLDHTTVTDPHPALNTARYRIIGTSDSTGVMYYVDADYDINETGIIIQWDEAWSNFLDNEGDMATPPWAGSLLRLIYDIDIQDNHSNDVSKIQYIGRQRPVSYYGTQLGESSTWKFDIPKDDKDILYGIRRLSIYKGDVYVREPSGTGYWATITTSYNINHNDLIIPVTLNLTPVEGGA